MRRELRARSIEESELDDEKRIDTFIARDKLAHESRIPSGADLQRVRAEPPEPPRREAGGTPPRPAANPKP